MRYFALTVFVLLLQADSLYAQITDFDHVNFAKADSIAALYPNHSLRDIKSLSDKLTLPLSTPFEKFRAIYTWVCYNIENDYLLFTKNNRKRTKIKEPEELKAWNKEFSKQMFKVLVDKHKTVCTGYAYLIRELSFHAGITAVIVDGYGRTAMANIGGTGVVNHSWNAVLLNEKWYLCDATWSSGAIDLDNRLFIKKFDSSYFLANPTLFIRNHYPLDSTKILLADKPSLENFLNGPLTYTNIYYYGITSILPNTFIVNTQKNQPTYFAFDKNNTPVKDVTLRLIQSGQSTDVNLIPNNDTSTKLTFTHTFTSKGKYTAHPIIRQSLYLHV